MIRTLRTYAPALALTLALAISLASAPVMADEAFTGPTQGKGISNKTVGLIDLGKEFPEGAGRFMRLRRWEVAPGGVVPLHDHSNRPSMIYVLEGEIVEHRSDSKEPHVYRTGDVSVEAEGVKHWWENKSDTTVILLAYDVFQKN